MTEYDSPWKEALDRYFESFMALCFPVLWAHIDWSVPPKMLDKELQQIAPQSDVGQRTVDKLVEVRLLSGEIEWLLIHLEIQSQPAANFAERMFVYFYRIRDKYDRPPGQLGCPRGRRSELAAKSFPTRLVWLSHRIRVSNPQVARFRGPNR